MQDVRMLKKLVCKINTEWLKPHRNLGVPDEFVKLDMAVPAISQIVPHTLFDEIALDGRRNSYPLNRLVIES